MINNSAKIILFKKKKIHNKFSFSIFFVFLPLSSSTFLTYFGGNFKIYITLLLQITAKTKALILYPSVFLPPSFLHVAGESVMKRGCSCVTLFFFSPVSGCIWLEGGGRLQLRLRLRRVRHISSMACGGQRWLKTCHLTLWPHFKGKSVFVCKTTWKVCVVYNRKKKDTRPLGCINILDIIKL